MPSFLGGISYSGPPFSSTAQILLGTSVCGDFVSPCTQSMATDTPYGQPARQGTPLPPTTGKPCARSVALFPKL